MIFFPNGEHTANNSRLVPIEWASCDRGAWPATEKRNRLHRFTKADGPQLDMDHWPVVHDSDTCPIDRSSRYYPRVWTGLVDVGLAGRCDRLRAGEPRSQLALRDRLSWRNIEDIPCERANTGRFCHGALHRFDADSRGLGRRPWDRWVFAGV